jgi:hypothetical protein
MIISFARTTAALVAGRKTVTRRQWKDATAAKFAPGSIHDAWSMSPRFMKKGARKIGTIEIVSVTKERTCEIPDSDWEAEGFAYMQEHGLDLGPELSVALQWEQWRNDPDREAYTVRFKLASIESGVAPEMFFGRGPDA